MRCGGESFTHYSCVIYNAVRVVADEDEGE